MQQFNLAIATLDDLPELLRMTAFFHQNSPYKDILYSEDKMKEFLTQLISAPLSQSTVIVTKNDARAAGMIAGLSYESIFNRDKWATDVIYWLDPDCRTFKSAHQLISAYEYWAKEIAECKLVSLVCLEEKTSKLYTRKKYVKAEFSFFKEL